MDCFCLARVLIYHGYMNAYISSSAKKRDGFSQNMLNKHTHKTCIVFYIYKLKTQSLIMSPSN